MCVSIAQAKGSRSLLDTVRTVSETNAGRGAGGCLWGSHRFRTRPSVRRRSLWLPWRQQEGDRKVNRGAPSPRPLLPCFWEPRGVTIKGGLPSPRQGLPAALEAWLRGAGAGRAAGSSGHGGHWGSRISTHTHPHPRMCTHHTRTRSHAKLRALRLTQQRQSRPGRPPREARSSPARGDHGPGPRLAGWGLARPQATKLKIYQIYNENRSVQH